MSDLIINGASGIPDGLYVIKDGLLFKYKPNGGSVRSYYVTEWQKGKWKCMADSGVTECDQCGWSIEEYVGDYNFCPICGADMRGEDE